MKTHTSTDQKSTAASNALALIVNGQSFELLAPATIANLIELRQPRPPFAVELNKQLVPRSTYGNVQLSTGDLLEIVTLVGGG